jgi:hypothetical protein
MRIKVISSTAGNRGLAKTFPQTTAGLQGPPRSTLEDRLRNRLQSPNCSTALRAMSKLSKAPEGTWVNQQQCVYTTSIDKWLRAQMTLGQP